MVALYADEQFFLQATQRLRQLKHDVLTAQDAGNANQRIPDDAVLAFASSQNRAVLTLNRRNFIRLHQQTPDHGGIVVAKDDRAKVKLADHIHRAVEAVEPLTGKLVRVSRSSQS
ncbi:DUF5615 family PIN-like protein [Nodosilinea sp. PGN35]|uniref:DUF5615 family PIN-like protein n=1 Tax=Nodosilinea sp. PGN35 TaxID=3020489 RepID=UPI0023B2802D|nr:DUF5615 family PIN-like protein [Nodosilinea sp. TSF1-S3]MDF0369183.1 DUF5615 family PIN-like protein [Nodosilinea sp. TSF1-S3]